MPAIIQWSNPQQCHGQPVRGLSLIERMALSYKTNSALLQSTQVLSTEAVDNSVRKMVADGCKADAVRL